MNFNQAANILGVEKSFTPDELKKAYRKRAFETHPDRGGNPTEFLTIQAAYQVLRQGSPAMSTYEETPSVLMERIDGIKKAFAKLLEEVDTYIYSAHIEMNNSVISTLNSYTTVAQLKKDCQNDLMAHWVKFIHGTTGFIEGRVSQIANQHEDWLREYLKPVVERARYENPPKWYQKKLNSYILIAFSMFSVIVAIHGYGSKYVVIPAAILLFFAVWSPYAYQGLFRWKS